MRQSHLILSNAVIMWVAKVLILVPQLILVPFLIRTIGEEGYGVYALIWSLMMSIEQLHRSLQSGVVKYTAGFLVQGKMDEVNRTVSSSFVYSLLLAVLACVGIIVTSLIYNDPSGQINTALVVMGIMVLFIFPLTPYIAVIQARQRYYIGIIADTVSKFISLFAVIAWFEIVEPSVESVIIIMAGMLFLSRLAQIPFAYRLVPGFRNNLKFFNMSSFRLIAAFGLVTVLASLSLAVNSTGVRWLMGALASRSFVAHLAIMLMPAVLLSQIIGAVTTTIMPATSAYEATGNQKMLQELLIRGMRYSTIIVLAGLLAANLLMGDILRIWVGAEYVFLAPFAMALFISRAFMLTTSTAHHMLKGLGKLRGVVFIYWLGLVIVPLSLILAVFQFWQNPYISVTVGLAFGYLVSGCLQIGFGANSVKADLYRVLLRVYIQPIVVFSFVYLIIIGVENIFGINGFIGNLVVSVFAVLFFLVGSYIFIATIKERQDIRDIMNLTWDKIASIQRIFTKY